MVQSLGTKEGQMLHTAQQTVTILSRMVICPSSVVLHSEKGTDGALQNRVFVPDQVNYSLDVDLDSSKSFGFIQLKRI